MEWARLVFLALFHDECRLRMSSEWIFTKILKIFYNGAKMGGRGFESRQKRPKLKDENICILGDASFSHKKSIPDQKGARSSASISRVCPGRVGADPGTHLGVGVFFWVWRWQMASHKPLPLSWVASLDFRKVNGNELRASPEWILYLPLLLAN